MSADLSPRSHHVPPLGTLSLEPCLTRLNELLVGRSSSPRWWSELGRSIDELAHCFSAYVEQSAAPDGLHRQVLDESPRLAFQVRGLERDNAQLAAEIAELRAIVTSASTLDGGLPIAMAATTEVIARIRGYQRRVGTVIHEAFVVDLGETG